MDGLLMSGLLMSEKGAMIDEQRAGDGKTSSHRFALPRILAVLCILALIGPIAWIFIQHLVDFPVYYSAGRSLIAGRTDLYASDFAIGPTMDYRYPPFFLVSLIPLWHLLYRVAAYVWYLVGLLGIAASCWAVLVALAPASQPRIVPGKSGDPESPERPLRVQPSA